MTFVLGLLGFLVIWPIYSWSFRACKASAGNARLTVLLRGCRFSEPGIAKAFLNTLVVTGVVQGISLPIAILIAWVIARTDMPGARLRKLLFWITFFIPTLAVTSGWILIWDPKFGLANQFLTGTGLFDAAPFNIYSLGGIVFTHLTSLSISTKVMMMAPAFRNLDANLEEAARMSGAGALSTLFRIVVPASTPMVCVASLMSLIRSFESFEVELVLGTPFRFSVYSTKIYALIHQTPVNYGWRNGSEHVGSKCDSAVGHFTTLGQSPPALHHAHRTVTSQRCSPWASGAGLSPWRFFWSPASPPSSR